MQKVKYWESDRSGMRPRINHSRIAVANMRVLTGRGMDK